MKIENLTDIIQEVRVKISEDYRQEYGVLATLHRLSEEVYTVDKRVVLDENRSVEGETKLVVSRHLSYSLLRECLQSSEIPLLLHTHPYYGMESITFSIPDRLFIQKFISFGMEMGISEYLFLVMNDKKYQAYDYRFGTKREEVGVVDEALERGFFNRGADR